MLDWQAARVFLEVARTGSMLAAARTLKLSQPTVSRLVQELEQASGQRLFVRHARGVRLSRVGEALRAHAERAELSLESFERVAKSSADVTGVLRIATTEFFGVEVLAPRLHELRESYPELRLELVLRNEVSDLTRGDADVSVRLARPRQPDLVIKSIARVRFGMYASHAYLERRGVPQNFEQLLQHELIGFDPRGSLRDLFASFDSRLLAERFALGTDCLSAHLALARGSFGIAGLQLGFARRYPELVRIMPELPLPPTEVWLVTHEDLRHSGVVRAGFDWLERVLGEYASSQ